jgi:tetratricopeptide (TPR) repeat protein
MMRELAKNYMSIGVFMSAYELLVEVELWEDCILCLFMGGRATQAEELAKEQLAKSEKQSPGILCLLGDIKRDHTFYLKAWEVSNHKHARAMRSIARYHFFQNDFKKSIECYETALAINRLYPDAWFTLGCAYMRVSDW